MVAYRILDIKKCMAAMLAYDSFDCFCLGEANIVGKVTFVIDGHVTEGFYSDEEKSQENIEEECIPYSGVRQICFDMIKGRRTPESFRFSFLATGKMISKLLDESHAMIAAEDVANMTLNIKFSRDELVATSAVTLRTFSMDKTLEIAWDEWVTAFFKTMGVTVENML